MSSTTYNAPVNLGGGKTIKAVATMDDYIHSDVATQVSQITAETPVITIAKPSGNVTISCGTSGATIYYTTDGSDPDPDHVADSTHPDRPTKTYSASFTVSNGVTVKAVAKATGYTASEVAANRFMLDSGTSGGVVTLNDAEDHTWTYYSDPDSPIRSLNPADVQITYYGNGDNNISTTNGTTPANNSWTEDATTVAVGPNDDADTFVYYKTLERTDGSTSDSPTGRCEYTAIPNPFSVRPTYTYANGNNNNYCGFYKWRVKTLTGGSIYDAATGGNSIGVGGTIDAEQTVYFDPSSEYGMIVELEALWARAYVTTGSTNLGTYVTGTNAYERNFHVVTNTNQTASNYQKGYPVTISSRYPNGNSGGGTFRAGDFAAAADTKIEYLNIGTSNNNTWSANNHSFVVGRGITGTVNYVRGIDGNVSSPNYTIRIESGTFNYLSFLRGYSTGGNNSTDTGSTLGGTPQIKGVLGCDYDRATNSGITNNLIINNGAFYGYSVSEGNGITYSEKAIVVRVKSGKIGNNFTIDGSSYTADAAQAFYIGVAGQRVRGHRQLFMEGGEVASIAGGIDATANQNNNSLTFRMTGGHVRGVVYGGGARSAAYGNRNLIVTGGTITGWIGGGCNGEAYPAGQTSEDTYGGITNGASKVYFGGSAICGGTGSNVSVNGSVGGVVFGAGKGVEGNTTSGRMSQGTTVVIADSCDIEHNVYGGGNYGYAQTSTDVYVAGGTVHGRVFGGSNQNNGPVINITMKDGKIEGGLYGGSNTTGTISSDVTMQINGGQVGVDANTTGNIHGGGYGSPTGVTGNIDITLGEQNQTKPGVIVYGDVYGGSALGQVNGTAADASKHTNVTLNKGDIHGNLYGGALGDAGTAANVYGTVAVVVNGGSVTLPDQSAGVFGCNNVNGAPKSTVTVTVTGTADAGVDNVFGGGNHADYTPPAGQPDYPTVTMSGGTVNNSVFGGGNEADIKGNANVTISGGTVYNRVFGGGNLGSVGTFSTTTSVTGHSSHSGCIGWPASTGSWSVGGKCTVSISGGKVGKDNMRMPQDFGYVFGASRGENIDPAIDPDIEFRAYVKETDVTISGTAFILGGVYGGSENGHVRGNTYVKIQGGQIGCGSGKTVPYTDAQWLAAETAVQSGDAAGIIAAAAAMPECSSWRYQNPYLPYDLNNAAPGGATTGSDGHTFYGNVFGGGSGYWPYEKQGGGYGWSMKAGQVEGNTKVEITGGHILTSVYGGNELTDVTGDSCVVIMTGGTLGVPRTLAQISAHPVTCYLFGAGKGDQRVYFNEDTNVNNVRVHVGGTALIYGSIFGGGEDGHTKGSAKIDVTGGHIGTWGTSYVDGNVFGAGRGFAGESLVSGVVQGNVTINISGGTMLGSIYGGGRLASVGTYLVASDNVNYGKLIGSTGDTDHGNININILGGTIGNSYEYIVPTGNWTQQWKDNNNITYTEFGTTDTDRNRLTHTKGGNVFAGCMGRLYKLNGITPISNWPDLGKVRKTVVNISGGNIKSNVYGGGELGTVAEGTTINITGGIIGTGVEDSYGVNYTYGSVFGGGYGSEDNVNGTLNDTRSIVNSRDYAGLVIGNTDINISGSDTRIWASVYGGGELAKIDGSTDVSISAGKIGKEVVWEGSEPNKPSWAKPGYVRYGGYRMGNVFGGGKGSLDYVEAGHITGNAKVTISGGDVYHNVYGGGALGSVGTFIVSGGNTTCADNTGKTEVTITGGTIGINGYDNGMVDGSSRGAEGDPDGTNIDRVAWVNSSIVKIGTEGQGSTISTPIVHGSIYGGGENGHNYSSSEVNIYSGSVGNSNGTYEHGNIYGAGCGTDTYESNGEEYNNPMAGVVHGTATVNIKGGKIYRNIYGGGSMGSTEGKATVNITGGRMGSVYGGPKGKEGAKTKDNQEFAYCGANTEVNINYASTPATDDGSTTQLITGSVFGGGEAGNVKGSVVVNMREGWVKNDLYGGGSLADTNIGNATNYGQLSETIASTSTNTTTINLTGGVVEHNVYGGGLGRKAVAASQGQDAITANPAYVYGDVLVELNKTIASDDCVVRGVVHGANNYNGSPKGEVTVHIYKTVDDGANVKAVNKDNSTYNLKGVYGGGNEAAYIPYVNSNKANVIIDGCDLTSIKMVYGGGNAASVPATQVTVNSCYEIGTIFGGGNGLEDLDDGTPNPGAHVGYKPANYIYDPSMTREQNIEALDAAFNAQKSTLSYGTGEAKVDALGGRIHKIYGGSNTKGNVRQESVSFIDQSNDSCPLELDEAYGGGNEAFMDGGSSVKLGCISYLGTLYGGANAANVGGDIDLTITSGTFDRVFGGNNQSGTITGSITVNIEETGCHPIIIGELYGCGNQAPYTTPGNKHPSINVKSFTSIGRIFGGGFGATAVVTGNPTVNINEVAGLYASSAYAGETKTINGVSVTLPAHAANAIGAIGTVFGGGNAAKVVGNTTVNIGTASTISYVSGNDHTDKTVLGANITGNVFGGGNAADVTGNTNVFVGK